MSQFCILYTKMLIKEILLFATSFLAFYMNCSDICLNLKTSNTFFLSDGKMEFDMYKQIITQSALIWEFWLFVAIERRVKLKGKFWMYRSIHVPLPTCWDNIGERTFQTHAAEMILLYKLPWSSLKDKVRSFRNWGDLGLEPASVLKGWCPDKVCFCSNKVYANNPSTSSIVQRSAGVLVMNHPLI